MLIADSLKPDPDFSWSILSASAYSAVERNGKSFFYASCKGDTLSLLTWDDPSEQQTQYDLRIINQSDTTLVVLPASKTSIQLFDGEDTIRFRRQRGILNPGFKFEKIVFKVESSMPVLVVDTMFN